ncbi:MAG: Crp/Fnr family transcriptional regulator [Wenzhouxiangella sp.]
MKFSIHTTIDEARQFLQGSPWMQGFEPELRDTFLAHCRLLPPFKRGQRVYNVGDRPDGIYGVVSGSLGFEIGPDDEGPQLVHQIWPGDWFGELAHVLNCPRLATLQASRPSLCVRISARDLNALLNQHAHLWKHMALSLAHVSVVAMTSVHDLMERSPRRRLVATLLRVSGIRNGEDIDRIDLELDLTHGTLAALSNLSRSLVADILHELELLGWLRCRYGKIRLMEPSNLRQWLHSSATGFAGQTTASNAESKAISDLAATGTALADARARQISAVQKD